MSETKQDAAGQQLCFGRSVSVPIQKHTTPSDDSGISTAAERNIHLHCACPPYALLRTACGGNQYQLLLNKNFARDKRLSLDKFVGEEDVCQSNLEMQQDEKGATIKRK